ncbi:MAG TPA: terminase gpA endonuclease subunit [Phycisphaerae bacterium]|nr:terminase gpA endonuclease subunit [Phycisphaerae bacterium]
MDLRRLTRSELLELVNSTPLGAVLTRGRLRAQLDAGGAAFAEAGRIDFVRYIRWLALESDRPHAAPADYFAARRRQAERNRAATKAAQDIAPIPDVADWPRREAACGSLRAFCETYFAAAFCWPWSAAHLDAIAVLEDVATTSQLYAFEMFRGAGKTTLLRAAGLWALLGNRRRWVEPIAATQRMAETLHCEAVKTAILTNERLGADFPEAIYPLRCLENSSKRQLQQHAGGELTHVRWDRDRIVFPWIAPEQLPPSLRERGPGAAAAQGVILRVDGLDGSIRGGQHTRPDGSVIRPDWVLLDDPQTRQSARSATQTDDRMGLLYGDVLYLAGHDQTIAAVALVTKIFEHDLACRLLDAEECPEWRRQSTAFFVSLPANESLWEQWWDVHVGGVQAGDGGAAGNRFYRKNRRELDRGGAVSWTHAYDHGREVSAIQHGMHAKFRRPETFWAEMQGDPRTEQLRDDVLTPRDVAAKLNGRPRGVVPAAATVVTVFVDVSDNVLWWCAAAWEPAFTGYVIDYGAFPEQGRHFFTRRNAKQTLTRRYRGRGRDAAIQAGLGELVADLTQRSWQRAGGGVLRAARVAVDCGHGPEIVAAVKHAAGGASMWLARGMGIGARHKPMSEYRRKPGEQYGWHWYVPNVRGTRDFPHVVNDVNFWKSFVHGGLAIPLGERGCLSLFGKSAREHEMFAEHVAASETWVETAGRGRVVHEWTARPGDPDNHWLDCLVGCAAAASQCGIATPGETETARQTGRKRYTQADLTRSGR